MELNVCEAILINLVLFFSTLVSLDDDLDDLLDVTKSYGKAKTAASSTPSTSSTPTKISSASRTGGTPIRSTVSPSTLTSTGRKALPPLLKKKGPPRPVATDANDEEWLDSVLG